MIREIVVELFVEVLVANPNEDKQVIQLTDTLDDIIKNKVDNYKVEVYGVSLRSTNMTWISHQPCPAADVIAVMRSHTTQKLWQVSVILATGLTQNK